MAKKIKEQGIILSKFVKSATESFFSNGQVVPAMPERPTLLVACGEFNGNDGIQDMSIVKFVVEKSEYDRVNFMDEVEAAYEYNGDGKIKPLEITIK